MRLAHRVKHPAKADGGQQKRQGELRAEHRRSQIALRDRHALPGPERQLRERGAIVRQRDFVLGPAVDVVEDQRGQTPPRPLAQIGNADDAGRLNVASECGLRTH